VGVRRRGRGLRRAQSFLSVGALAVASLVAVSLPVRDAGAVSDFVALDAPLRLLDTRPGHTTSDGQFAGIGRRAAGSTLEVQVAGRAGVPVDAATAVLTVTAVAPLDGAFLTVHPTGTARPNASNVNYDAGHNTANTVLARLGTNGKVSIYTFAASHLVVDVSGHLPTSVYTPLPNPVRLADTRPGHVTIDGQFAGTGVVPGGNSMQLHVAGRAGIPDDASTAVFNVTAVQPLDNDYITVHPTGTERPTASNINYSTARNTAGTVLARLGAGGDICIFTHATSHLVIDIAGYIAGPPPPTAGPACPPGPLPTWAPPVRTTGVDFEFAIGPDTAASDLGIVTVEPSLPGTAASSTVSFSTDAIAWSQVATIPGVRLNSVVAGGPGFVAVGRDETSPAGSTPAVWTSPDGIGWSASPPVDNASFPFGEMHDVAATASGLLAVGATGDGGANRPAAWSSVDGLGWSVVPGEPFGAAGQPDTMAVAAGAGGVAAIGQMLPPDGFFPGPIRAWWSSDGRSWIPATDGGSFADRFWVDDVEPFGSGFVTIGETAVSPRSPRVWTSPDGRSWSGPGNLPEQGFGSAVPSDLAVDGSVLVAVGSDRFPGGVRTGASIWMSSDAVEWIQVPGPALDGDAVIENFSAFSVVRFASQWIVLGTTWAPITLETARIVWSGS